MARDEQEGQRGIMQVLRTAAIKGTAAVMGVSVTHNCRHCGEVIVQGDNNRAANTCQSRTAKRFTSTSPKHRRDYRNPRSRDWGHPTSVR